LRRSDEAKAQRGRRIDPAAAGKSRDGRIGKATAGIGGAVSGSALAYVVAKGRPPVTPAP
jgi:hypothetical protein